MAIETCTIVKRNLGLSKCIKLPGYLKGMIEVPEDFVLVDGDFATLTALKTALQAALLAAPASRSYLFPLSKKTENVSTEAQYEDTPVAMMPTDDGKYAFKLHMHENMCIHKALYSHRASSGRVIFFDKNNNLWLTEVEGGYSGYRISMLHTEKFMLTDGGGQATTTPVYVVLEDNLEVDAYGVLVSAGNVIGQLKRLTDVTLTIIGAPSATTIVVDVLQSCDNEPVLGLEVADFVLTGGGTLNSLAFTSAGRYTLTGTGIVDGTLNLDDPADLSIQAYESEGAVAVNVP